MAGEDKIFYPVVLSANWKNMQIVSSPQIKAPIAVRYGFYNFPQTSGFFYNKARLPIPSFRTDDWEK